MLNILDSFIILLVIFIIILIITNIYMKFNKNILNKNNKLDNKKEFIKNYIGITLICFGLLKLYDIEKFSEIFSKYDIISKKINIYPYFYPFIEIFIGVLLLKNIYIKKILILTKLIMLISIISVIIAIQNGNKLRCGCLGSFFHIPLSYVTLSENLFMLIMSLIYLIFK